MCALYPGAHASKHQTPALVIIINYNIDLLMCVRVCKAHVSEFMCVYGCGCCTYVSCERLWEAECRVTQMICYSICMYYCSITFSMRVGFFVCWLTQPPLIVLSGMVFYIHTDTTIESPSGTIHDEYIMLLYALVLVRFCIFVCLDYWFPLRNHNL